MSEMDYARGYEAGYRAGLRRKDGKAAPPTAAVSLEPQDLKKRLECLHTYMLRESSRRGGYIFEGARLDFERGEYQDAEISELLRRGWIMPHTEPDKGWVPVPKTPDTDTPE